MKKSTKLIFSVLAISIFLNGCGGTDDKKEATPAETEKQDNTKTEIDKSSEMIKNIDTFGNMYGLKLSKNEKRLYAHDDTSLKIIDIQDINSPKLLGSVKIDLFNVEDVLISSDETKAFVSIKYFGLKILDIRNPSDIKIIGKVDGLSTSEIVFSSDEKKIYTIDGDGSEEFITIDISDATSPQVLNRVVLENDLTRKIILSGDGKYAFLAGTGLSTSFKVIDIQSSKPAVVSNLNTQGSAVISNDIAISKDNKKAYVCNGGFTIIDISNPAITSVLGYINDVIQGSSIVLSNDGEKAFVIGLGNLYVIDIRVQNKPKLLKTIKVSEPSYFDHDRKDIALSKDETKIYIANDVHGLTVLKLTD